MTHGSTEVPVSYEPPRLVVLGTVHELTLTNKTFGTTDGNWFVGGPTPVGLATVS